MKKAWVFQDSKMVKKHGSDACAWYVGWVDPNTGKRHSETCGTGKVGKRAAERKADKRDVEIRSGTYKDDSKATWENFREKLDELVLGTMSQANRQQAEICLDRFERICKPKFVRFVTSEMIEEYIAKRMTPNKTGKVPSVETINKEVRYIRLAMRRALKWGYTSKLPDFVFKRLPDRIPCYVTPEHFVKLYAACGAAIEPSGIQAVEPAAWWRAFLVFAYTTGWRIGQILSVCWDDVDLDSGRVLSRAEDNKGKRDALIVLPDVVVDHLRGIRSFEAAVFPWQLSRRQLYPQFDAIQMKAEVKPDHRKSRYTFHDLRRGFATMNAERMTPRQLQEMMQHRDFATTQLYINMARQLKPAAANVFVPNLPSVKAEQG